MRLQRVLGLALAACLAAGTAARADFVVDNFTTASLAAVPIGGANPQSASQVVTGAGIVGTEREMVVTRTDGTRSVQGDAGAIVLGTFGFSTDILTTGFAVLTYDGVDGGAPLNTTGLGGVDLTQGGVNSMFTLSKATSDLGSLVNVTVYDFLGGSSVNADFVIPSTPGILADVNVAFDAFTGFAANPNIFANVGAIVVRVDNPQSGDVQFNLITTRAVPEPGSLALLGLGVLGTGFAALRRRKRTA